ncbi:PIG-L family deacetylase [uncultured Draconibacterium sp.]|uniref:PIG-L deacetylase family protein n=1 Tax=uncultured Draconibacterium sp. TaxID=1573823 RepID=UPI0029C91638|nr:PIG-L family deacetylase [uncultured Draconibacterium sp.]
MAEIKPKEVAIIVAHPDDETLWAGGTILSHPSWNCFVVSVCRGNDPDRSAKFYNALKTFNATGAMGTLDDSPEQKPLDLKIVEQAILELLPAKHYHLIISHNPSGEYTRHIRHEEVSKAVIKLWYKKKIATDKLWTFAYEDGKKKYYPRPEKDAAIYRTLTKRIWKRKYSIITETYGFDEDSWEAKTTPKDEAFRQFTDSFTAVKWLNNGGVYL